VKKGKKIAPFILVILACAIIVGVVCIVLSGKKPFKNLNATDVESATVLLMPPDETIQITDIEKLTGYLRNVVIYNEDNSYTEYSGQGVIFTLAMTDGTQVEVVEAYNLFIIIDGVGYKCKYEPCKALSNYANRLLRETEQ
jgi:hypothetical protein